MKRDASRIHGDFIFSLFSAVAKRLQEEVRDSPHWHETEIFREPDS